MVDDRIAGIGDFEFTTWVCPVCGEERVLRISQPCRNDGTEMVSRETREANSLESRKAEIRKARKLAQAYDAGDPAE